MSVVVLDRPVWNMLIGPQAALAIGDGTALRIDPSYGPFAATFDASDKGQIALAGLISPGEQVWLVEPTAWPAPPRMHVVRTAPLLQMVATSPVKVRADDPVTAALGEPDSDEMTRLAVATEPGPWAKLTRNCGQFYGLHRDGRLAAMAGVRMQPAEHLHEVSGVCTWPEFRGAGLAGALIRRVMADIVAAGRTPFLHSYAGNTKAIDLYRSLGFEPRREMVVTVLERE